MMRIVVDRRRETQRSYTLREDWRNKYESIYTLLSRFAYLNGFTANELIRLFISSKLGVKTKIFNNPNVDLRCPTVFDLSSIGDTFHLGKSSVETAFLHPHYAENDAESVGYLRTCPQCLNQGFHAPLFQLNFITTCPVHHQKLNDGCPHCSGLIPYRLTRSLFKDPYCCPHCKKQLAQSLLFTAGSECRFSPEQEEQLKNCIELTRLKHDLIISSSFLDRQFFIGNHESISISPPATDRHRIEYFNFIESVIQEERKSEQLQLELIQNVVKIEKGVFEPPGKFSRLRQGLPGKTIKRPRELEHPFSYDSKFVALLPVYKGIVRYLWHHFVGKHRRCVYTAARHLWWHSEGTEISNFCPIAQAFLRWRMYWEISGVPQALFRESTHIPLLLLAWLSEASPWAPPAWTKYTEQWVSHRVFSSDCLRSFAKWLEYTLDSNGEASSVWRREDMRSYYLTYWAVIGEYGTRDSSHRSIKLFMDSDNTFAKMRSCLEKYRFHSNHLEWHLSQLRKSQP